MHLPSTWGRGVSLSVCFLHGVQKPPKRVLGTRTHQFGDRLGCLGLESYQMPSLWPLGVEPMTLSSGPFGIGKGEVCVSPPGLGQSAGPQPQGQSQDFPSLLAPPLSCQPPPPPLFSLLSPASFSCVLCSASSPPSSCPFFSPSFQGDLSPPPGNRFLQTIWSHSLPLLISPVHPLQHAATAEMF